MTLPLEPPDPSKVRDAVLDVFVFAPIGFLFDAREVVPRLAERGRNQVTLARLFGRFAIQRGQFEAERILAGSRARSERSGSAGEEVQPPPPTGVPPTSGAPTGPSKPAGTTTAAPAAPAAEPTARSEPRPRTRAKRTAPVRSAEPTPDLAITNYDSLSASQVVPRLDALRPEELEAIRVHEAAHRGRRTILNRIAQLQS